MPVTDPDDFFYADTAYVDTDEQRRLATSVPDEGENGEEKWHDRTTQDGRQVRVRRRGREIAIRSAT